MISSGRRVNVDEFVLDLLRIIVWPYVVLHVVDELIEFCVHLSTDVLKYLKERRVRDQ